MPEADEPTPEQLHALLGGEVSDHDAQTLVAAYAALRRAVMAYPFEDLRAVEPPLRSMPGP